MSGFNNPVVGALNLIRRAIRSPNYQAGAEGWSINQDGSAEFNDGTFRVSLTIGPDGMPQVIIGQDPTKGFINFPTGDPSEATPGSIYSVIDAFGLGVLALFLQGPTQTGDSTPIAIGLTSGGGISPPELVVGDDDGPFLNLDVNSLAYTGVLDVKSLAYGFTSITPVANAPTSKTITGLNVAGTAWLGYATANTTVIGSQVQGVAISGATGTGLLVWVYRTNNTATFVNYQVVGLP